VGNSECTFLVLGTGATSFPSPTTMVGVGILNNGRWGRTGRTTQDPLGHLASVRGAGAVRGAGDAVHSLFLSFLAIGLFQFTL
jgi:hypothetical protein